VPPAAHYDDWAQLENGVGLVRQLLDDWQWLRRRLPAALPRPRHLTMACATLIAPVLGTIVDEMNRIGNLRVDLHVVRNRLFGDEVTVSGLMVGRDLLDTLDGRDLGETLVLPRDMFDHSGRLTLDDMTRDDLVDEIARPIATVKRFVELHDILMATRRPVSAHGDQKAISHQLSADG
jgi:NifB/MoaA-like Fe-S oxidoreductase